MATEVRPRHFRFPMPKTGRQMGRTRRGIWRPDRLRQLAVGNAHCLPQAPHLGYWGTGALGQVGNQLAATVGAFSDPVASARSPFCAAKPCWCLLPWTACSTPCRSFSSKMHHRVACIPGLPNHDTTLEIPHGQARRSQPPDCNWEAVQGIREDGPCRRSKEAERLLQTRKQPHLTSSFG